MSNAGKDGLIQHLGADGAVSAEDVLFLRRTVFADGVVSRDELESLLALAARAPDGAPEWALYVAEASADFYLREEEPHGYLTDGEFEHLNGLVARHGVTASVCARLSIGLMEKALSTPAALSEFAADQLRQMVSAHKQGARITQSDAALVQRYLYAAGGAGAIAVTREEAELLFDLHEMTRDAANDAAWADLFIKAIAAHLMAHVGYRPLPREDALRLHEWVKDQTVSPAGFFSRMVAGGLSGIRAAYGAKKPTSRRSEDDAIAAAIAEQVTAQEADWLADRFKADGEFNELERMLLAYMRELGAELPPKLQVLVEKAA